MNRKFLSSYLVVVVLIIFSASSFAQMFPGNMTEEQYKQLKTDVTNGVIQEPVLYQNNGNGSRQGGDTPASATVVGTMPYFDSGTTVGYSNFINDASCGTLISPDVFYELTTDSPRLIQVTTCGAGTNYDSKLAVFRNNMTECIAFNDDDFSCGVSVYHSTLEFNTCPDDIYYIVVDGFGGASGTYDIQILDLGASQVACEVFDGIFGSTGSVGASLIGIDPSNGNAVLIGSLNSFGPVTEITSDPTGMFLYGSTGGGTSNLITIDPLTSIETLVGTHPFGALNGLEFVGSTLYGTYIGGPQLPSTLVMVNPGTAALTPVGLTGRGPITGLAYNKANGIMYGITAEFDIPAELVTINLTTGMATTVGPIGVASQCRGLVFDTDGQLYTATANDPNPGFLILVNPHTGAGTLVGPTGFPAVSGLAVLNAYRVPLSGWAIGIGIFLIVVASLVRFRKFS